MPMPLRPRTEKPHRLRDTRVALHDKARQKIENNIYALKKQLLSDYMKEELKNPSIPMSYA